MNNYKSSYNFCKAVLSLNEKNGCNDTDGRSSYALPIVVEYETMLEGKYYCRSSSSRMMFKMMNITSFNNTQLSILIHGIVRFKTYV